MLKRTLVFTMVLLVNREGSAAGGEGGKCRCVPYYQCPDGSFDVTITGASILRKCEHYLDVCCDSPVSEVDDTPSPLPVTQKVKCGLRNRNGGVRSRDPGNVGDEAEFGEFPWIVAVTRADEEEVSPDVYQCGGTLIHPKVVLTAAHCVAGKKRTELKIRAGKWEKETWSKMYGFLDRYVESIVVHENFMGGNLFNDVALLFLSEAVDPKGNFGFACLPGQGETPTPGTRCFAAGWEKNYDGEVSGSPGILRKVDLPVVANPECQATLRKTRLGNYFKLHQSFMCAGGEAGKDTCKGDGGNPLMCPSPGHPANYIQSGIVAWGIGCGNNQTPGVYANVALFRNWIDERMHEAQLETTFYSYA